MKKNRLLFFLAGFMLFAVLSCNKSPTDEEKNKVTLSGQVINSQTQQPIANAVVMVQNISSIPTKFTDSEGKYLIEFKIDNTTEILVVAFKESYVPDSAAVIAVPGRVVEIQPLRLTPTPATLASSGVAATIILKSQSAKSIGVRESGAVETARLTFEVQDSIGTPIDIEHGVVVNFLLTSSAGGEEFIYPLSARTGYGGQVETYLTSGTKAGVIQLEADAQVGNHTIRSKPIAIAIHGGLPHKDHFTIAATHHNFPGYRYAGALDTLTAYAGDRYANPVRPGTAVYFTTTGGNIQGSATTGNFGEAIVDLISGAPLPFHPVYGAGFGTVTATTLDEDKNELAAQTIVLFSGTTQVSVTPSSGFEIPNGGSVYFDYVVDDEKGNPLTSGTQIKVDVKGFKLQTLGYMDFTLGDFMSKGPGTTQFWFEVSDTSDVNYSVKSVSVNIDVKSKNGNYNLGIYGTSH